MCMHPGEQFGRYRITRLIGRGAMGEVYLATDVEAGRNVALKVVYKGPQGEDQDILDAERLGAELQKRLSGADSRVVAVRRYGEINGDLFIEMEYIEGEDLSGVLARGPAQPAFAAYVAFELCGMLENLSTFTTTIGDKNFEGVVHGDIKPRNVRLDLTNHVKVMDFGIAKALSNTSKYTMNLFASAAYCSPERLESQKMDAHSDLWSVGVLLYQMIAGRLPFDDARRDQIERRIRTAPPDPLPSACPDGLRRIVSKMLTRDAAQRYPSATAVKDDLTRFQRGEPVLAQLVTPVAFDGEATTRTAGIPATAAAPAHSAESDRTMRTTTPPRPRSSAAATSSRVAIGCLGIIGVICVIAIGFATFQFTFWKAADKLKTDIEAERVTNLDQLWTRYQTLENRQHIPGLFHGARGALERKLVADADTVINAYRDNEAPAIYEAHWIQAKNDLARALEIHPGEHTVLGRLRLCEGHIERIEAGKLKNGARQKRLNSALMKFTESAALLKHSPDPYLGLARLYAYDLSDAEKAEEALNNASRNGHAMGKRELAQLADAYRRRGDRIWRESRGFAKLPGQERDYLDKARQDYQHAQDLYSQAGLFGDSGRNQTQAIQALQRVERRISEVEGGLWNQ